MDFLDSTNDGRVILTANSSVTLAQAAALKAQLLKVLDSGRSAVLNLEGTEEIDLACLQVVLAACRTFAARGQRLEVADSAGGIWTSSLEAAGIVTPSEVCQ
jgi:anti-anti-sigma regulatory factor